MTLFAKITLLAYFGMIMFISGHYSYWDEDGYGIFTPIGGYHFSTIEGSN